MSAWEDDKRWSDRFIPQIKRILGETFIGEPPEEEDAEHNTDLIVLTMNPIRIACRVRKAAYAQKYGTEFTIRAGRPTGAKTELAKIIEGWGDYLFYGFSDASETEISQWIIVDFKPFRLFYSRYLAANGGKRPGIEKMNADQSSYFVAFDPATIPGAIHRQSDGMKSRQP